MQSYFTLTSRQTDCPNTFAGYAFTGDSIVLGAAGHASYQQETGRPIGCGEDGCYASAYQTDDGLVIGNDALGYMHLFYFDDGSDWAVSNSFALIVRHLKTIHKLQINKPVLNGFVRGNFRNSPSLDTPASGVCMVAAGKSLLVVDGKVTVRPAPPSPPRSYAEHLKRGMEKWLSLIETFADAVPEALIRFDISGGLDSRTSLAFERYLSRIKSRSFHYNTGRPNPNQQPGTERDYEIAQIIAERHGLELNQNLNLETRTNSDQEALEDWKLRSLGVYADLRPQIRPMRADIIRVGGLGGENVRPHYNAIMRYQKKRRSNIDFALQILRMLPKFEISTRLRLFPTVNRLLSDLDTGSGPTKLVVRYFRELRGRTHFGSALQSELRLDPLAGQDFVKAMDVQDDTSIENSRIYFDIIGNLAPELLDLPFDNERKRPPYQLETDLTRIPTLKTRKFKLYMDEPQIVAGAEETSSALTPQSARDKIAAEAVALPKHIQSKYFSNDQQTQMEEIAKKLENGATVQGHQVGLRVLHSAVLLRLLLEPGT